jgi:TonB family protein
VRFKPSPTRPAVWLNPGPTYYPREAYAAKAEGTVKVGYDIDEIGMVANVHLVSSSAPGVFDEAAIADVKNRVFRPMVIDGRPTADGGVVATLDYKLADAKIAPKLLHSVPPYYPSDADKHGIQGYCVIEFTAMIDGSVADPKVVISYPSGVFDKASLDAFKRWKFEPAETLQGPVQSVSRYAFMFRLARMPDSDIHYLEKGQWVKLDYTLQANGHTRDIVVVGQSQPGLPVSKAVEQLTKTKFNPIIENGVPVEKTHQMIMIR